MSAQALLARIRDLESASSHIQMCEKIISFMIAKKPEELRMLTFNTFASVCHKNCIDAELMGAIAMLVSMPCPALEAKTMLVDEDTSEFEISLAEVKEAEITGELIHPEKGSPVEDFRSRIFPFFAASEFFFADE